MIEDARDARELAALIEPGERILWSGRPDTTRMLAANDVIALPVTLASFGVVILVELSAPSSAWTRWFGVIACLVGVYVLFGRFVLRPRLARRTVYAITDRRALSVSPWLGGRNHIGDIALASQPSVVERAPIGERGTVVVGGWRTAASDFATAGDPALFPLSTLYLRTGVAFWNIPNAHEVADLIRRAIASADGNWSDP
jgi:hypothetical protein